MWRKTQLFTWLGYVQICLRHWLCNIYSSFTSNLSQYILYLEKNLMYGLIASILMCSCMILVQVNYNHTCGDFLYLMKCFVSSLHKYIACIANVLQCSTLLLGFKSFIFQNTLLLISYFILHYILLLMLIFIYHNICHIYMHVVCNVNPYITKL